ncbi:MAG TPA: hypothetical protein VN622_09275 [Clostridia bacterium]|nr:hypothetical protein [Clostridia bacterium]
MTNALPADVLEQRAAEQRRRIHNSVVELRSTVRDKLDVKRNAREHLWPAVGVLSSVGLMMGYRFAGAFVRH